MSGRRDDIPSSGDGNGAPIDLDRLDAIVERLATDERFTDVEVQPEYAPDRLMCRYDLGFYPQSVQSARFTIAWFENGDFSLHYHEEHEDGTFDHRWDRHLSTHNSRDHIHPSPSASTPGDDASHPEEWRDVMSMVLSEIEERQQAFWTE
ncbi:hypothetical protein HZS55_06445 [Halosimplex rubrum]|uniref:Uncharacterized protein n=1 Tax=Halosimplex rubrum TaxID=869889 RepID=A0A7D5TMZ8_9EURY|nr:hypothetical protein [Halosimplex rubrum]QLH76954.1 hypothetical protein HZS55_06445 [Halosimplex rubrum]